MQSGVGASWHSLLRPTISHGGSAFGGTPPVTPAHERLWGSLERQAAWLGIKFIRAEMDWRQWQPQPGVFTWLSPEMKILDRILGWAQQHGSDVMLQCMWTDVEWLAFPEYRDDPARVQTSAPADLGAFATGWVTLLRELVQQRGYTCIKWITLVNEPNHYWWLVPPDTPEQQDRVRQARYLGAALAQVRSALAAAKLPVKVMGPDYTDLPVLPRLADEPWWPYVDDVDFHSYCSCFDWEDPAAQAAVGAYRLGPRMQETLQPYRAETAAAGKGLYLTEFGTQTYGYKADDPAPGAFKASLKDTELLIRALNLGVDGLNHWSLTNRGDADGQWQLVDTWDRGWMAPRVRPASRRLLCPRLGHAPSAPSSRGVGKCRGGRADPGLPAGLDDSGAQPEGLQPDHADRQRCRSPVDGRAGRTIREPEPRATALGGRGCSGRDFALHGFGESRRAGGVHLARLQSHHPDRCPARTAGRGSLVEADPVISLGDMTRHGPSRYISLPPPAPAEMPVNTPMLQFACDLGGTRVKLALIREAEVLARSEIPAYPKLGLRAALQRMGGEGEGLCQSAGVHKTGIGGFALAFPGIVEPPTQRILSSPRGKFDDAGRVKIGSFIRRKLGVPVYVVNDANAALAGEVRFGAARGCRNVVMLTLGTGIGTSVLIDGVPLRGKHGLAGNLGGHFTATLSGRTCSCGNVGCVETEASTWALPDQARRHPGYAASRLAREAILDYRAVFACAARGDRVARELRKHALEVWSLAVVNMIHAYDPELVVLGGGIMQSGDEILHAVRQHVAKHAWTPWGQVKVVPAALGNDAGLLGVASLASAQRNCEDAA
jgi:glucokinase